MFLVVVSVRVVVESVLTVVVPEPESLQAASVAALITAKKIFFIAVVLEDMRHRYERCMSLPGRNIHANRQQLRVVQLF
jgi:hypothetical protein